MWATTDGVPLVYLMLNCRNKYTKIGVSMYPEHREKTLQSEEPEVALLATIRGGKRLEAELHDRFAAKRLRGEWFDLNGQDYRDIWEGYGLCIADDVWFNSIMLSLSPEEVLALYARHQERTSGEN